MRDHYLRILSKSGAVRGLACLSTHMVNEACHRHGTSPTASAALGRALTGSTLMGALLKRGQRVALKFEGNGPAGKIVAEAAAEGRVRGYVGNPAVHVPLKNDKLDVAGALGNAGLLTVTKDLRLKEPYTSTVHLRTGEIGEDLAYYFTESEQIPSAVGLGVYVEPSGDVSAAGGFLIQAIPPGDDEEVAAVIERIRYLPSLTELIREGEDPEQILARIFADVPYETLEHNPVAYYCPCSRERIERGLLSLGAGELQSIIAEQGNAEAVCEFCHRAYQFDREDLEGLLREIRCS